MQAFVLCLSTSVNLNPDINLKGLLPSLNLDLTVALKALKGCDTFLNVCLDAIVSIIGDTPGTLFVPSDLALQAAGLTAQELLKDSNLLHSILKYHFAPHVALSTSKVKSGVLDKVLTANLWPLTVDVLDGAVTITSDKSVARSLLSNIIGDKVSALPLYLCKRIVL